MSRTVNREHLFEEADREIFRRQMWLVADYCGVEIITYAVLSNHFHVLLRIPQKQALTDQELLRRYKVLYPTPTAHRPERLEAIEQKLAANGPDAEEWRQRQLCLMGDVSDYMLLLKTRFSIWFNRTHDRCGPLWIDRFNSVMVEPKHRVIQTMALYIDLNCVRAGLVADPKDYPFCGYGEAVGGEIRAKEGLRAVVGESDWTKLQTEYRMMLFGVGAEPQEKGVSIPTKDFDKVMKEKGKLPLAVLLLCRIRHLSRGAVLGSKIFVEKHLRQHAEKTGRYKNRGPLPVPAYADWGELTALRGTKTTRFD